MYKCCIFDLDGTLANTLPSIAYFGNSALEKFGFAPIEQNRYRYLVGMGAKILIENMLAERGCDDKEIIQKVYERYNTDYDADPLYLTAPYEGIPELLQALKAKGLRMGILSNKPQSTAALVSDGLFDKDLFDVCIGKREGLPLKPDPTVLLSILSDWGIEKKDCLYIGDTAVDMQTAQNAGVTSVGVLWGFRDREELEQNHASHIIAKPQELLSVIG